jgi:cation diffusion facilitator CzcD-associated flavoprotein CzcO
MEYGVVIVGAGFAGLGMAMTLKRAGRDDFVILEKAAELGGTWWENTYPGCGCDIASHLYSFSFAPKTDWSRAYAEQPEILGYLKQTAERFDVVRHIRFNTELVDARFDEPTDRWVVTAADGSTYIGQALVLGVGALNQPTYPDLPGLPSFTGPTFHSARWNHDVDLTGKRVAVIGTGASAIQLVPRIAPQVAQLHVVQRTAPWLLPRPDHPFGPRAKRVFATVPPARWAYRSALYWRNEIAAAGFTMNPKLMRAVAAMSRRHLRKQVADPALRAKLTPSYTIGCKRILIASDYYPALTRPNVELVTEPITEVGPQWIVTDDGTKRGIDVIIFGTGFRVVDKLAQLPVTGLGGVTLAQAWRGGVEAYLGMTVAGFPNLFILLGPNTVLGHNSVVFMIEAQLRYVMRCLDRLRGARRISVDPAAQRRFNARLQRRMRHTVWLAGGCRSWYLDAAGVNRALWSGSSVGYWLRTRRPRRAHYILEG